MTAPEPRHSLAVPRRGESVPCVPNCPTVVSSSRGNQASQTVPCVPNCPTVSLPVCSETRLAHGVRSVLRLISRRRVARPTMLKSLPSWGIGTVGRAHPTKTAPLQHQTRTHEPPISGQTLTSECSWRARTQRGHQDRRRSRGDPRKRRHPRGKSACLYPYMQFEGGPGPSVVPSPCCQGQEIPDEVVPIGQV